MAELHFAKPCTFTDEGGVVHPYAVGRHKNVPDAHANHWWVKEHLAKDGDAPPVDAAAPLQHEERVKVKAAMDVAENRAKGAEAERDAAVSRAEKAEADLVIEKAAHAETMAQLDAATAPDGDEVSVIAGPYTVARGGQGSYKVMKGDEIIADKLPKVQAEFRASELNSATTQV